MLSGPCALSSCSFSSFFFTVSSSIVTSKLCLLTDIQVLDNHVVRYIPPDVYRHYPRYKSSRWFDKYGGVVVGALSMHPFQVTDCCGSKLLVTVVKI